MPIALSFQDTIAVLHLGDNENRFSPEFLDEFDAQIDDAISLGAHALVTVATGKFYSNGLDLDWLAVHGDQTQWYVGRVQALLARMLTLQAAVAAMTTGRRFGGKEAAAFGIVDATAEEDAVTGTALNILAPLGAKDPGTIGAIKNTMFASAAAALKAVA